jgi:hypothetical protein
MMKNFTNVFLAVLLFGFAGFCFAQDGTTEPVSYDVFVAFLLQSLGGFKGAGSLAVVAGVIQILMKLFQTSAGELLGKWKLLAVALLSLAGGMLALKLSGVSWSAAALHGTSLAAAQVFLHQLYKQFIVKSDD